MAQPRKRKVISSKFDKSVDSGPLGSGTQEDQQTIQDERIRRQIRSKIGPKPGLRAPK